MQIFEFKEWKGPTSPCDCQYVSFFSKEELKTYVLDKYSTLTKAEVDFWVESMYLEDGLKWISIGSHRELAAGIVGSRHNQKLTRAIEKAVAMSDKTLPDIPKWMPEEYGYSPMVDNVHKLVVIHDCVIVINSIEDDVIKGKIIIPLHDKTIIGGYIHYKGAEKLWTTVRKHTNVYTYKNGKKIITSLDDDILLDDADPNFKANFNALNAHLKSFKEEGITGLSLSVKSGTTK